MFTMFLDRAKKISVLNKSDEYIVINRVGSTNSRFASNYVSKGMHPNETNIINGDVVIDGNDEYFVVAMRKSSNTIQSQLYKANAKVNIFKIVPVYVNGNKTSDSKQSLYTNKSTLQNTVTANSRLLEPGILPNVVKRFILPKLNINLKDRIELGTENYQVEGINDTDYEGLLYVQCSSDVRVVK